MMVLNLIATIRKPIAATTHAIVGELVLESVEVQKSLRRSGSGTRQSSTDCSADKSLGVLR
jgi:hypothetical protein